LIDDGVSFVLAAAMDFLPENLEPWAMKDGKVEDYHPLGDQLLEVELLEAVALAACGLTWKNVVGWGTT
jgi:hypothetical protein